MSDLDLTEQDGRCPSDPGGFWTRVFKSSACWEWQGSQNSYGYGVFWLNGKPVLAHRLALTLSGECLVDGLVVDHTCRNRMCVNPAHLRQVTRYVNVHENSSALAHLNKVKTHCPKGHPYSGDNLAIRISGRRRCRACEANYHKRRRSNA